MIPDEDIVSFGQIELRMKYRTQASKVVVLGQKNGVTIEAYQSLTHFTLTWRSRP